MAKNSYFRKVKIMDASIQRVEISEQARNLLASLKEKYQNKNQAKLVFYHCDSSSELSSPLCLLDSETRVAGSDLYLGAIDNCDFFIKAELYAYWANSHLIVDVVANSKPGFSLETDHGYRFIMRTRALSYQEFQQQARAGRPLSVAELSAQRSDIRHMVSTLVAESSADKKKKGKAKMRLFAR